MDVSIYADNMAAYITRTSALMILTRQGKRVFVFYEGRFQRPGPSQCCQMINKVNFRDLIAATGLVILLKLDSNRRFFSPCDLEIWWMTPKNNRAPLLCYFKLFASFRSHWWFQTGVTVWKRLIWVKIDDFFSCVTLQFDGWPLITIGHLFYATSSFVNHFVAIGEFKLELQSGNA